MFSIVSCSLLALALPAERPLAIRAEKLLLGDGRTLDRAVVIVEDGKIARVGPEKDVDVPSDAGRYDHAGWASAGLVALQSSSGATGELRDSTRATMPEARAAWTFEPNHPEFRDLVEQGVTSVVLAPTAQSLVGGVSAIVKTAGGTVLAREAQLSLGFSQQSLSFNRFPTSSTGGVSELERLFGKPTGTIERARRGELPVLFEVEERADVLRAIDFARRHELKGVLSGAEWSGELAKTVKDSGLAVICPPMRPGEDQRTLRAVKALGDADVLFGFGVDAPWSHPASLRLAAAMCKREGLPPARAWRAITSDAARIAGAEKRIGSVEEGLDADLVLWSGDPLVLSSTIVAVYVDGKRVYAPEGR